ncbi:zinc ABC transporter substrate-binding protein [Jannaschia sp. W003]|uniref:zinc ABC transporter substrate-binding protein n=1 Tax=Jannaschia sp. W003 TaxID=2867012 RepID=UPI0021A291DB|nr:zinc ABC transporter substrate-binding protein [Jannaschia sp. W003]UWQ20162.1 zinc ABC transporter substrate-binding protein [Jannaschia sp. W003]
MSIALARPLLALLLAAGAAAAEVPQVTTDIAPVHGLAARVMEGLGTPALVVGAGASPHHHALRPSEARALEGADAVFWIGPALEPWLAGAIGTLAGDAEVVELMDVPGATVFAFREGAAFGAHDHEGEDDHGTRDPHLWLDPENGKVWLDAIAETLAALDPSNADAYRSNAARGRLEIDAAVEDARAILPRDAPDFVVFHDAFHYFEDRFDLAAAGAIAEGDASDPAPARIEAIRALVRDRGVACVFAEPQFDRRVAATVLEGTGGAVHVIDPLGADIPPGPDFYPALIRAVAAQFAACAD